jgi:hypothetical protein
MKKRNGAAKQFVICIDNSGYPASLELHKIYSVLPDQRAAEDDYLRVIDESGEDYLYSAKRFLPVDLPEQAQRSIVRKVRESTMLAKPGSRSSNPTTRKLRQRRHSRAARG